MDDSRLQNPFPRRTPKRCPQGHSDNKGFDKTAFSYRPHPITARPHPITAPSVSAGLLPRLIVNTTSNHALTLVAAIIPRAFAPGCYCTTHLRLWLLLNRFLRFYWIHLPRRTRAIPHRATASPCRARAIPRRDTAILRRGVAAPKSARARLNLARARLKFSRATLKFSQKVSQISQTAAPYARFLPKYAGNPLFSLKNQPRRSRR